MFGIKRFAVPVATCVALGAVVIAGCGSNDDSGGGGSGTAKPAATSSAPVKLKFGLTSVNMLYAPYVVGQAEGIFKKNGLDLSIVLTKDAATAETAVASKSTPIGAITTDAIAIAHQAQPDVAIMLPVVNGTPYSLVTNSKIAAPKDLHGKALAASGLKTADGGIIVSMLDHYGLKVSKDYSLLIAGDPAARTQSLLNGKSMGLATPEPQLSLLRAKGFKELIRAADVPGLANRPFNMIATTKSWAQENPQAVVNFEKAWLQSVQFMYDPANKDAVIAALAKELQTDPKVMTQAYQDWMVDQKVYSTSCDVPAPSLQAVIAANQASGNLSGTPPTPESLTLGGDYCSKASAG
ncbi:ABC transporter substrate-binding protein [Solirubrobacter ginsenosidimutans]|uniref:ABC transporter substrate-binding protein n=1 Tax=Solirubrobacter ginsenosidimutans TaxID=490573 RepID=A0A9X3MT82_9ACTN|nr:ABC transporter substrate-binding protein [Solirubrobacter ginsenosidimutans]MDA0159233.1 ABC transporter substrate-binding protein [Solirubrobacter ginsenosidimutans]